MSKGKQATPYRDYSYTQAWLILLGLQCFALFILQEYGLLALLIEADATYLSLIILATYAGFSLYCGARSVYLDGQHHELARILSGGAASESSLSEQYFHNLRRARANHERYNEPHSLLVDVLSDRSHSGHELGWYICSVLVKAGMVGTVIGFVLMLRSVSDLESFDITQMQELLITMSAGMGVALYTTLTGVVCSALLGYQYLQLDRAADALVLRTVEASETGAVR